VTSIRLLATLSKSSVRSARVTGIWPLILSGPKSVSKPTLDLAASSA